METNELVKALRKEAAANPCAGLCSACDIAECMTRLQIQAADRIEKQAVEIKALRGAANSLKAALNAMERDFRTAAGGWDECEFCAHCCIDEKPEYRPDEKYLEYCNQCVDGSCFEWRGVMPGSTKNGEISES